MICVWSAYEVFMKCLCSVYEVFMNCLWTVYELLRNCLWSVYELFMTCLKCLSLWSVYEVFMMSMCDFAVDEIAKPTANACQQHPCYSECFNSSFELGSRGSQHPGSLFWVSLFQLSWFAFLKPLRVSLLGDFLTEWDCCGALNLPLITRETFVQYFFLSSGPILADPFVALPLPRLLSSSFVTWVLAGLVSSELSAKDFRSEVPFAMLGFFVGLLCVSFVTCILVPCVCLCYMGLACWFFPPCPGLPRSLLISFQFRMSWLS